MTATAPTAAVLLIGDEILSGRTKDRNLGFIADFLFALGIDLEEARVVPDIEAEIVAAVNALRAGVTDSPALRKIPGNERLLEGAALKNPARRLTTPQDVAGALVALCHPDAGWVTGNVINVDGGEEISAG